MRHLLLLAALALLIPACGATDDGGAKAPSRSPETSSPVEPSTEGPPGDPPAEVETETLVLEVSGMT